MAKSSVYSALLKPTAERGRNVFPLDTKQVYSQKAGQIIPVKPFHFLPGDHFEFNVHDFSMTFPMNTAAFLRGRREFAFYSVYYNAIWSLYNQYQGTKSDPKTSAFGQNPFLVEPRIRLVDLYFNVYLQFVQYILAKYFYHADVNEHVTNSPAYRWLNTYYDTDEPWTSGLTNGEFNDLFDDFTTSNSYFDLRGDSDSVRRDYLFDIVGQFRAFNWCRKLDMLGYGNIYPLLRECEDNIVSANLDWTNNYTLQTNTMVGDTYDALRVNFNKLATALIDCSVNYTGTISSPTVQSYKCLNLYPICAYNAIFYHFFRNSYYDLNYYVHNYNLDFVSSGESRTLNQVFAFDFDLRFLDIEYHQWKKDTFTGVLPDTQFGAVSSISFSSITGSDLNRWTIEGGLKPLNNVAVVGRNGDSRLGQVNNGNYYGLVHSHEVVSSFDVIALKRAEMLQEYRQQLMRAGNKTSDVFKAIYGGAPSSEHEDDVIPRFLETFGNDLFVDPVQATATTGQASNGELGDLSARAKTSGSSGKIVFNAGMNFGVILPLCYIVPTAEYNSYMIDRHLLELTPEQHFIPQFENLGLEPIYNDELNSLIPTKDIAVLGYAPRYHHKKTNVDQVHGAFVSLFNSHNRSGGVFNRGVSTGQFIGEFNHWVSPRSDFQSRTNTQLCDFYVNPRLLDNVFVNAAGADIADDQFICNTYFEVRSTRQMSKVGLLSF